MKICELLNFSFLELIKETEERLGKDQSYMLDSNKLRKELGWQDTIDLEKGIQSTIEWIDKNLDTLRNLSQEYIHIS